MTSQIKLHETICAICETKDNFTELYQANFAPNDFTPEIFSARRLPDKIHYRIVQCNNCGLVRSNPVIDSQILTSLYSKSTQTYDSEIKNLTRTYFKYIEKAINFLEINNLASASLLEIGCGSGFLLEKALKHGFGFVQGVEPSADAVRKSPAQIRPSIIHGMLEPGLLQKEKYDLICMFQVFDHIANPDVILKECIKSLKPKGGLLIFNHDVKALSARILGESSPIFDIEHTYLYDKSTIKKVIEKQGLEILQVKSAINTISIRHLMHLSPLNQKIKLSLLNLLKSSKLGNISIPVQLGNLYMIAKKV
jgi:2-polyprenyl-3-methyl-5-hydroxy-6-metoxy-1,4-benzoquinol methylase